MSKSKDWLGTFLAVTMGVGFAVAIVISTVKEMIDHPLYGWAILGTLAMIFIAGHAESIAKRTGEKTIWIYSTSTIVLMWLLIFVYFSC